MIDVLVDILADHELQFNRSFSLIPSENMLSPLARAAYLSDAYSRYFFDEHEAFGRWSFEGGSIAGRIQQDIVLPLLKDLGRAAYVDVHPISGLTGMMVSLAAFGGGAGSRVISVPPRFGGHPDTRYIAEKLGYEVHDLPFASWDEVDIVATGDLVERVAPSLIYLDHATALMPLDVSALVRTARAAARTPIHIHVDSSHVNGLIWGGQLPNPLDCGADSYGGSTHKTFPGPHKAVIFTNRSEVYEKLFLAALNMVSHHHLSSVIALGIALVEFVDCGGQDYAEQIIANAQAFSQSLAERGMGVQGRPPAFTHTHQVWLQTTGKLATHELASLLFKHGLVVNPFNPIPSLGSEGIRMGVNEATRLGLDTSDMYWLADMLVRVMERGSYTDSVAASISDRRAEAGPRFCFSGDALHERLARLARAFADERSGYCKPQAAH